MRIISWIINKFKREQNNRFDILSDIMNTNDKIKTAKEGSFTFYIHELNLEELKNCKVGDYVNFWSPEDSSDIVYIYRSGTVGGSGKILFDLHHLRGRNLGSSDANRKPTGNCSDKFNLNDVGAGKPAWEKPEEYTWYRSLIRAGYFV